MTRRPLDIATDAVNIWTRGTEHVPYLPRSRREIARDVLDALTTDPDMRERVAAAIHSLGDPAHRWDDCTNPDVFRRRADAVLAALRDDEPVTRPFAELRDAHHNAHPGAAERVAEKVREIREEETR